MYKLQCILCLLSIALLQACSQTSRLKVSYSETTIPPAPDYSNPFFWAALPEKTDSADHVVAKDLPDNQANAEADVFFLHPTSYFGKQNWNATISSEKIITATDTRSILHQASVFNGSCKIYAPRYRQVSYHGYFTLDDPDAMLAFDLAYTDIRNAFQYYLDNYNNGRPIIIASHSQGTTHAIRLLQEFFDGKPLQKQLVAAYLIGMPVSEESFTALLPCNQSDDAGCYVSWRSFLYGYTPRKKTVISDSENIVVINPLSWNADTTFAPAALNQGGLGRKADEIYPAVSATQIHDNYLWVTKPDVPGKFLLIMKNYHVADYNLYWMNIRENVMTRLNSYQQQR